jgi:hypothetical protein
LDGSMTDANTEMLRDLALTNLVAAEIRASLREPRAAYVKWHYSGAFNGAAWACADSFVDVMFYRAAHAPAPRAAESARAAFSAGVVLTNAPGLTSAGLAALLAGCQARFDALVAAEGPGIFARVARVLLWCSLEGRSPDVLDTALAALVRDLREVLPGTCTTTDPHPAAHAVGSLWFVDVELALDRPGDERSVTAALTSVLPDMEGGLFEPLGLLRPSTVAATPDGTMSPARGPHGVDFIHALGRQF